MRKLFLICSLFSLTAFAGESYFEPLNVNKMHGLELERMQKGQAPHFAVPHQVNLAITQSQDWKELGSKMEWTHSVKAPNAVSLNFGFTEFSLPQSAQIDIYAKDFSKRIRTINHKDNNINHEFWTPVLLTDEAIIKVSVDKNEFKQLSLTLGTIGQGFRTFAQSTQKAGSCNVDVVCSEGDDWRNEINSVAVISKGGSTFCTGFMVNNTRNDKAPYFMTAYHCGIRSYNAASLVAYWNYQTSSCGGSRDGEKQQFTSGATLLAGSSQSDFTLLKLTQDPEKDFNVSYAGWDRSGVDASMAVAIHHPNTDEKSISFEYDPTTITSYLGDSVPGAGTHVRVEDWDVGTTEPGSSGSPLFDQNHRVIGQLHGGYASCSSQTADYYGRFFISWDGEGKSSNRLRDHLDPDNRGDMYVDTLL